MTQAKSEVALADDYLRDEANRLRRLANQLDPDIALRRAATSESDLRAALEAVRFNLRRAGYEENSIMIEGIDNALAHAGDSGEAVADRIIGQIEERFPNWRSFRDLIDCIDCTLHQLRGEPASPQSSATHGREAFDQLTAWLDEKIQEASREQRKSYALPGQANQVQGERWHARHIALADVRYQLAKSRALTAPPASQDEADLTCPDLWRYGHASLLPCRPMANTHDVYCRRCGDGPCTHSRANCASPSSTLGDSK